MLWQVTRSHDHVIKFINNIRFSHFKKFIKEQTVNYIAIANKIPIINKIVIVFKVIIVDKIIIIIIDKTIITNLTKTSNILHLFVFY